MRKLIARTEDDTIHGINLVLAGLLFFSPWLLGFAGEAVPSWNAWLSAALIALVAVVALAELHRWEECVSGLLGVWAATSPWLLGFAGISQAMWAHVVLGLAIAVLAAYELWRLSDETRATAV